MRLIADSAADDPAAKARHLLRSAGGFEIGSDQALEQTLAAIAHVGLALVDKLEAIAERLDMNTLVAARLFLRDGEPHTDQVIAEWVARTVVAKTEGTHR